MNKKMLLITFILLTLSLVTIVIFNNKDSSSNIISNINKDTEVINNNMITMMYETDAGSGEYIETKDNSWPETGYIFNENLSGCERGGELEYNSQNNTVNLLSNKSDQCYVYFDKYDGVWIDNVSVTNVTGSSVTLDIRATSENGSITTYYYSLNDSEEYQESTSNIITINDLNKLTEYNIKIYAIDSTNAKSNIYEIVVSTTDENKPIINSVEVSDVTYNSFTLTVDAESDVDIARYHYVIESENIAVSGLSNYHIFSDLDTGTSYTVEIYIKDNNGILSEVYQLNVSTADGVLLADWVIGEYNGIQGNNGIYYHNASLANSAGDNSYRYSGVNPNNYVCFGSDATPCPSDNLYRIIGVFGNEVKLIKSTYYGNYAWDSGGDNTWNSSTKPDIYTTLNEIYLNSLESTWSNMIIEHNYEVGGVDYSDLQNIPQVFYKYEMGGSYISYTENMKIGLMYISDYVFSSLPDDWTLRVRDYDIEIDRNDNWLFLYPNPSNRNNCEWFISKANDSDGNNGALCIYSSNNSYSGGSVYYYWVVNAQHYVRPVFYLSSGVAYASGSGTQSDPIILSVN